MTRSNPPSRVVNKPTIMVIEDNADQWFILRWALLACYPEIDPIWFADPTQALLYLENAVEQGLELPRLLLLDLYLPSHQTGLHTLHLLKQAEKLYREIPVVMLSQSSDQQDIKSCYDGGANSFIVKPTAYQQWLEYFATVHTYWGKTAKLPGSA